MKIFKETQYLAFVETPSKGKTKVLAIVNKHHQEIIGEIKLFGRWRQYCFFPSNETTWNTGCLADIRDAIQELNEQRKNK